MIAYNLFVKGLTKFVVAAINNCEGCLGEPYGNSKKTRHTRDLHEVIANAGYQEVLSIYSSWTWQEHYTVTKKKGCTLRCT